MTKVTIFWPGDYRNQPNEWALPHAVEATQQMQQCLRKLGRESYVSQNFITKPHEAIDELGAADGPLIGIFTHLVHGSNTCEGVVGRDNQLLLAAPFAGIWPGLAAMLNTSACLTGYDRPHARIWSAEADWSRDESFMARLEEWFKTGAIAYSADDLREPPSVSPAARAVADKVYGDIRKHRILALMLGDTAMGMTNGSFGPRVLAKHGFSEVRIDQAWLPLRMRGIRPERVEQAFRFVRDKGALFHWRDQESEDFTEEGTRTQLQMYLGVLELMGEFQADCLGWQYQLGLWPALPPSDFCEGLLNSVCRPESNGDLIVTSTTADQGNLVPMELMKRLLAAKGLHQSVLFQTIRWGGTHEGRWLWLLMNSGSCGAYAYNHYPDTLLGVHSYRQPQGYFPIPGGTFTGECLPGRITWARAYLRDEKLCLDLGRGQVVKLPSEVRDAWWNITTRQWPFMAADLGCSMETLMAHAMSGNLAVVYGDIFEELVSLAGSLGIRVRVIGKS